MTGHLVDADSAASGDDGATPSTLPAPGAGASVGAAVAETAADRSGDETPLADADTIDDPEAVELVQLGWWARWRERRGNRISRWDRPPPPKDWRYFVGGFGRILIVTGLLMFGFVAYQLWGTGIETARAQSRLGNGFDEQIAAATVEEPVVGIENWVVPRRTIDPSDGADDEADPMVSGVDTEGPVVGPTPDELLADELLDDGLIGEPSEIVPGGVDLTDFAVEQDVPVIPGEAFARLDIPKIGRSDYVVPGVRVNDLKKGPGHYPDTPLPGQLGNASIAGHRTTYGSPFFDLDQLEPGDELIVTMVTGDRFVYRVTGLQVVSAADSWVITTRDPTVAEMTLTTCDPKYTARDRLVIHSVLVPEKSAQVGVAEFYDLGTDDGDADETPIPGDDPTFSEAAGSDADATDEATAGDAATESAATPSTTPDAESGGTAPDPGADTADPATDTGAEVSDETADDPANAARERTDGAEPADDDTTAPPVGVDQDLSELDAFEQGWFDDRGAFPQIALWAGVLLLITLLGYQAAKRTRRTSIGILVSVVPFVVALYFFYQNVNRLLPPGL